MGKFRNEKTPHDLVPRARDLRKDDTLAEQTAWTKLKDRRMFGLKFRRQAPIEKFIVDFYCHELRLIIELDGGGHAEKEQFEYDQGRDKRLAALGYRVVRISNERILDKESFDFSEAIRPFLPSPGASRPPLPEGEG